MRFILILLICLPAFAAAKVIKEVPASITIKGQVYEGTIKTIEQRGKTFEKMYISVDRKFASCRPNDPKDCEAAIKEARGGRDR